MRPGLRIGGPDLDPGRAQTTGGPARVGGALSCLEKSWRISPPGVDWSTPSCILVNMSYYRIQATDRDTAELLDESTWLSLNWGAGTRDCRGCADCTENEADRSEQGQTCDDSGEVEMARYGVSVCDTVEELAAYAAVASMDLWSVPMSIVELDGYPSGDDAEDAAHGESLICPTRVVSAEPVSDEFITDVFARLDA